MKTLHFSLAFSALALVAIPKTVQAQETRADQPAIRAVVERETTAWNNRDAAGFADCWANVPEAGQLVALADEKHTVVLNRNTRSDMPTAAKALLEGMGNLTGETFQNSDYQIRVKGNAAFAQFEQLVTKTDGTKEYIHETRYLEKMSGKWKIVHVGAVVYTPAK